MSSTNGGAAVELIYASSQVGTTTTPAAAAASMIAGLEPIVVKGGFMNAASGSKASSLHLQCILECTTTATIPTFKFGLSKTTAQPAAFSGTGGIETTTFTPPNALTAIQVLIDYYLMYRTPSQVAGSTVSVKGFVTAPQLVPSPFAITIPTNNGTSTWTDWEVDLPYFLWPYVTLGAATAGNTVTMQQVRMFGESA